MAHSKRTNITIQQKYPLINGSQVKHNGHEGSIGSVRAVANSGQRGSIAQVKWSDRPKERQLIPAGGKSGALQENPNYLKNGWYAEADLTVLSNPKKASEKPKSRPAYYTPVTEETPAAPAPVAVPKLARRKEEPQNPAAAPLKSLDGFALGDRVSYVGNLKETLGTITAFTEEGEPQAEVRWTMLPKGTKAPKGWIPLADLQWSSSKQPQGHTMGSYGRED